MSEDTVMVRENSGNYGAHQVVGAITRTKYGKKAHGHTFPMYISDQRAQPHLYILAAVQQPVVQQPAMPAQPQVVVSAPTVQPPAPVVISTPIVIVPSDDIKPEEGKLEMFSADEEGIDIGLLTLQQIKNLGLDAEDGAEAYEAEAMGAGRKGVLKYLQGLAGEEAIKALAAEDEE